MIEESRYVEIVQEVEKKISEFLKCLNLKVKILKTYEWNSNVVGIYIYRSSAKGVLRIGVNFDVVREFEQDLEDDEWFSEYQIEEEIYDNIAVTLWHEAGHGIMEHIKRCRRHDTQNGTGIFRGKLLRDTRKLMSQDEEDVVEGFGEYMPGLGGNTELYDYIMAYKDYLQFGSHTTVQINESDIRKIVENTIRKMANC